MAVKQPSFGLGSLEDLFGGAGADGITVQDIPLAKIDPFPGHPFQVRDDDEMQRLVESIKEVGVQTPVLLRERAGRYQLVSGHRRKHAAGLAGLDNISAIVRNMTDDEATIAMVDGNLQRERILPSERAWSYRMKLEAMKHQGKAFRQSVGKESADAIGEQSGESGRTVQRYIRLTYLIPELLRLVDEGKLSLEHGVRHSYDDEFAQREFYERKKLCLEKGLSVVGKQMNPKPKAIKVNYERVGRFFQPDTSPQQVEDTIERALAYYFSRQNEEG